MQHEYDSGDEEVLKRVGQNDPILASFKKARFRLVGPFIGIAGLIAIVIGALDFIAGRTTFANSTTDDVLIFLGIALLLLAVLIFLFPLTLRGYWGNVQRARQNALRQPQNFLVEPQPIPTAESPQPADIQWRGKRNFLIFYFFISYFVTSFILFYFVENFAFTVKHTIVTLITALLFASSMTVVSTLSAKRTAKVTVRITQTGITSYMGATESSMRWEDARLFACYHERILGRTRKAMQYELVSENTIVRWLQPKNLKILQTEPAMDQQQFEQWHEQLRGYVVERTGLPLVELKINKKRNDGGS